MNTKRPVPKASDPAVSDQPVQPKQPSPRRKFILPTFAPGPSVSRIDYRSFLSEQNLPSA